MSNAANVSPNASAREVTPSNITTNLNISTLQVTEEVATFLYVYIPLKAVIVVGNLLTVVAVAADRTRHTTPYIYTVSLAVADLLIGLSVIYDIILLVAPELQPFLACPTNFIMCAALAESAQSTTLIALDRTLVIKYSLRYPVWMTLPRTAAVVCVTAILSVAYSTLIMSLANWSADTCDIWTAISTHEFLLPKVAPLCVFLTITGCLYSYVLVVAYRHRVAIARVHSALPLTDQVLVYSLAEKMSIVSKPGSETGDMARSEKDLSNADHVTIDTISTKSTIPSGAVESAVPSSTTAARPLMSNVESKDLSLDTPNSRFSVDAAVFGSAPDTVKPDTAVLQEERANVPARRRISLVIASGDSRSDSSSTYSKMPSVAESVMEAFPSTPFHTSSSLPNLSEVATISDINAELTNSTQHLERTFSVTPSVCGEPSSHGNSRTHPRDKSSFKRNVSAHSVQFQDRIFERPPVRNSSLPTLNSSPFFGTSAFTMASSGSTRRYHSFQEHVSRLRDKTCEEGDVAGSTLVGAGSYINYLPPIASREPNVPLGVPLKLLKSVSNIAAMFNTALDRPLDTETKTASGRNTPFRTPVNTRLTGKSEKVFSVVASSKNVGHNTAKQIGQTEGSTLKNASPSKIFPRKFSETSFNKTGSQTTLPNRLSAGTRSSITAVKASPFGMMSNSGLWKSFRMFFLVWGIYFLTLTPVIVTAVVFTVYSVSQERIDFIVRIDIIFIFVNSGINVFIYAWKDRRLRKSLWLVLRCSWNEI